MSARLKLKKLKREMEFVRESCRTREYEAGADAADYYQENRKLEQALWLARGYIMTLLNRDFQRLAYQCNNDDYKKNLLRRRNRYYELSEKCIKKAKEYK